VDAGSLGDAGNLTAAWDGTNVSCMISSTVVRIVWINTSVSTFGEVYNLAVDKTLGVLSYGRVTDGDYAFRWPSCYWYNGTNDSSLMVVTRGSFTDVMFFDFGNEGESTTDDYQWVTDLTNMVISLMGAVFVVIVVMGMVRGISRSFNVRR
jgi:hypothetical protein